MRAGQWVMGDCWRLLVKGDARYGEGAGSGQRIFKD